ncbi:MAG: trypsin-like peptidase domain-containing protein, partial [Thermogutta sp.]|nr:trypsin-like peptidase domain-containing protein [Thermogutta sp.]
IHNHAALAAWWDGDLFCLEVQGGYGGRAVTLESRVDRHPGRIDVYAADPDGLRPDFDRRGAVRYMRRWMGRPYGYRALFALALRRLPLLRLILPPATSDAEGEASAPFCSQACAEALRAGGGVDPVPNLADRMTEPADLARSAFLRYRCTLLPDGGGAPSPPPPRSWGERIVPAAVIFLSLVIASLAAPPEVARAGGCPGGRCGIPVGVAPETADPPGVPETAVPPAVPETAVPLVPRPGWDAGAGSYQKAPWAAVARIANELRGGMTAYGTGTLIAKDDRRGWVLTCAHLFRDGVGRVTVSFAEGAYAARVLGWDREGDLAVLEIAAPSADPLPIRGDVPAAGEAVTFCGYGTAGRLQVRSGRVLGYVHTAGLAGRETLQISGGAENGDSGGPILDAQGRLAGVLWGTDGTRTVGSYCGRIRAFLARLGGLFRADPPPAPLPEPLPQPLPEPLPEPLPPRDPGDGPRPLPPGDVAGQPEPEPEGAAEAAGLRQRLQALAERLGASETAQRAETRALSERLKVVEAAAAAVAQLRQRVEAAEAVVGKDNLRGVVREVAGEWIAERGPDAVETWLPRLLTALGWSGPPSLAVILAARAAVRLIGRRVRPRAGEEPAEAAAGRSAGA